MNNRELIKLLERFDACSEAVKWIRQHNLDLKTAWAECQRVDWMLWFLERMVNKPGWPNFEEVAQVTIELSSFARRIYTFAEHNPLCDHIRQTVKIPL